MRISVLVASLIFLPAVACNSGPGELTQAQKDALTVEVAETLEGLTEAINSHDPDRVSGYFQQNEEFLYLGCTSFLIGWDTFSPRLRSYHVANPLVTFQQEIVRIQVLSPTVAVAALQGSSSEADALFWTEVLVREDDGRWLIAHEHESWPECPLPPVAHPYTTGEEMPSMGDLEILPDSGTSGDSGSNGGLEPSAP